MSIITLFQVNYFAIGKESWESIVIFKTVRKNQCDTLHENKSFCLRNRKDRKHHIFISFCMFLFHGNIIFSELSENVRNQHLLANAYSCLDIKFSYTKAVRKDEIFFVVLLRKQAIFHLHLVTFSLTIFRRKDETCYVVLQLKYAIGQLLVEDVYIFILIFCRKRDRRVEDLFFSPSW